MIYSVKGELIVKENSLAVVECGGVGYACRTTLSTISALGETGSQVKLYTYLAVREDSAELFGFLTLQELNCFKLLLSVSKVGAKAALSILSDMSCERFVLSVASGDSSAFTKVKGVGAKTAQRIVLELKDKISKESFADVETISENIAVSSSSNVSEAVSALMMLGYSQAEAVNAVANSNPDLPSQEIIKAALKQIGKKFM